MPSKNDVAQSLKRVLVFFKPDKEEAREYIDAVHEQVADLCDADIFDRAAIVVVGSMEPFKRPVPVEYINVIRGIKSFSRKGQKCDRCDGTRQIFGREYSELYGKTVDAMLTCPDCRYPSNDQAPPAPDEKTRAAGGD